MKRLKGVILPSLFLLLMVASKPSQSQSVEEETMTEEAIPPAVEVVPSTQAAEAAYAPELGTDAEGKVFYKVRIADPFIELHTGPGAGYPIF